MSWPSALSIAMNWPDEDQTDEELEEELERIHQYYRDLAEFDTP